MNKELINIDSGNIVIYDSDIEILEDEYISSLFDPKLISKASCFTGLLNLIHERYLKNILRKDGRINYKLCNDVFFNIYLPLCNKYNVCPTVQQFAAILIRVSLEHITDIKNGIYRNGGYEVTKSTTQYIKNWYRVTESVLLGKTVDESSIGSMFGLKALYGYSDSNPIRLEVSRIEEHETPEQIAERHKAAFLPEKPDL